MRKKNAGEVPIVLGTYDLSPLAVDDPSSVTPEEVRVSRYMQGMSTRFHRYICINITSTADC